MNAIKAFFVVIYMFVIVAFGTFLIAAAFQLITLDNIMHYVGYIYQSPNSQWITGCIGLAIALLGIILGQYSLTRLKKTRILYFDTEDGPTSIALTAIEDLIKRTLSGNEEVKDPKIAIASKKKRLVVSLKVQLVGNFSIQELSKILKTEIQVAQRISEAKERSEKMVIAARDGVISLKEKIINATRDEREQVLDEGIQKANGEAQKKIEKAEQDNKHFFCDQQAICW